GDKVTEDKAVADIMIQYMRDHGVEGRISDSVRSITISREGDLNSNSLIKSAERGEYEGFIIVRNGSNPSVIEDVLYASRDVGSSRFRGYVAQRNPDDQHSSNWGHVYWKNGDTVRIEDGYAGIMNFPTLEADREREVVTRERTTTNESWCDQNPNDCDALKILGVGIGLGLLGWGVYELTRPPEDNHHDRPPTPQPNPSGGGQDGGPGTGDQ
ncbi:MAG: hypothetical protein KKE20_05245, partial [Nanoarchaeota archaeon]|nr:hypothetical protein [Nanoarchaeota archaeon]